MICIINSFIEQELGALCDLCALARKKNITLAREKIPKI